MKLTELYNLKLLDYKINNIKERPDKLLAMLLLPEKDKYEPLMVCEGQFYNKYKAEIDEKIEKVINDFEITDDEIIKYIEDKDIICDDFEHDKVWYVFSKGFGAMHWSLMYHPEMSPEQIYIENFGSYDLDVTNEICIKYKKLYEACKKNPEIQLAIKSKSKILIKQKNDKL